MIQVLHRAFDILEFIALEPESPKALGEIADKFGLNHATCANIMKTMVTRRYLVQKGPKKGYTLGPKAYSLTGNAAYKKDIVEAARLPMEKLTQNLNESCVLAILHENKRTIIYRTSAEQDLQVRTADEKHAYDSASGRMLVSMLTDIELDRFLKKYGLPSKEMWAEASTRAGMLAEVKKIRSEKLATQVTMNKQIIGLAVPVYKANRIIASLSVYMPDYRYMQADKVKIWERLQTAAQTISQKLK
ncbi:MAG TPA: IclR family transcriptional regulator C-terminal domain-containing protein [Sphingobacteriaceae bacterium]